MGQEQTGSAAAQIKDGGPAFPVHVPDGYAYSGHQECDGMTLRDYFAAHVSVPPDLPMAWGEDMVGPCPKDASGRTHGHPGAIQWWAKVEAAYRYYYADAMLAARGGAQ
jgi:hypothetical protein